MVRTDYEALLDVAEGPMSLQDFGAHHVEVTDGVAYADAFFAPMALTPER